MQLVRDGDRLRRSRTVFGDDEVRFAAARIVALERVGAMQEDHHVRILLD